MVDFQDVLLPDENIHGINIRVNPPEVHKNLTLEEAKGMPASKHSVIGDRYLTSFEQGIQRGKE